MAPAPEFTTEFPTFADGIVTPNGRQPSVLATRRVTKNWAKAAGLVVATALVWLIVIAILIAI
jgi:hypothetical protein